MPNKKMTTFEIFAIYMYYGKITFIMLSNYYTYRGYKNTININTWFILYMYLYLVSIALIIPDFRIQYTYINLNIQTYIHATGVAIGHNDYGL